MLSTIITLIVDLVAKVGKLTWKPYKVYVQARCHCSVWLLEAAFSGETPKGEGELQLSVIGSFWPATLLRLNGKKTFDLDCTKKGRR